MKTYICIVFTDFHHTKLYPFQNLSLEFILKVFLRFRKFQPRYSYKIYSYRKKGVYSILYSPWECGWIKDSYPPGSQRNNIGSSPNRIARRWRVRHGNPETLTVDPSFFVWCQWTNFECVYYIIFTQAGKVYSEILAWIWSRDFVNERAGWEAILIIRSTIFC